MAYENMHKQEKKSERGKVKQRKMLVLQRETESQRRGQGGEEGKKEGQREWRRDRDREGEGDERNF